MTDFNGLRGVALADPISGGPIAPALDTSVQAVRTAVQAVTAAIQAQTDLTALFVVDNTTGKYYVRREVVNEGTSAVSVTFLNLDGSVPTSAPTVSNLAPVVGGATPVQIVTQNYDVATSGTGYATGDVVSHVLFVNTATGAITASSWYNITQNTTISAPTAANIKEQDQNTVISGAVTSNLDGSDPGTPAQANQGTGSRGWLATIAGLLKLGPAAKAASASMTIATDLANLEPAGAAITGAAMPAGGLGLTGWLSALWQGSLIFQDVGGTVTATSTTTGPTHDTGSGLSQWSWFTGSAYSAGGGTIYLEGSNDAANWYPRVSATVTAGASADLSVRTTFRYHRLRFVAGSTGGVLILTGAYTRD